MSTALATKNGTAHVALAERLGMSQEKLDLVRQQVAPNAPDDVLELYFERCRVAGADPFSRMFYAVSRNVKSGEKWETRWNIETTIDGFRSIAESTGEYDGQDEPVFAYDENGKIVNCKVTVYRKGMSRGVTAVAFWDEYVQLTRDGKAGPMWTKMPHGQLAKCAEALALRKAFPRQLSGLYTNDEMAQSANPEKAARRAQQVDPAAPAESEAPAVEAEPVEEAQYTEAPPQDTQDSLTDEQRTYLDGLAGKLLPIEVAQILGKLTHGRATAVAHLKAPDAREAAKALLRAVKEAQNEVPL